jgi:hypothetical protein
MINHALFVRREPEPGKEKEVALGSCARRLANSLMCVSLLLASAAATADNPPLPTQIVDLANKVDGVHPEAADEVSEWSRCAMGAQDPLVCPTTPSVTNFEDAL